MKKHHILLFVWLTCLTASAGVSPELDKMLATAKDPATPVQSINAMLSKMQALERAEIAGKDSQQSVLDIFQHVSYSYARNFHFRQGLYVYQGYLNLKDKYNTADKQAAIVALIKHNEQKNAKTNSDIITKKNSLDQLKLDIESWEKSNSKFSRNYSLVIILVTAVLAIIFLRINTAAVRAKKSLLANRERMLQMQRVASLGHFHEGVKEYFVHSSQSLPGKIDDLSSAQKTEEKSPGDDQLHAVMNKLKSLESKLSKLNSE